MEPSLGAAMLRGERVRQDGRFWGTEVKGCGKGIVVGMDGLGSGHGKGLGLGSWGRGVVAGDLEWVGVGYLRSESERQIWLDV